MKFFNNLNMKGNRIIDCPDTDMEQKAITFKEADKRENIKPNEKFPVVFGKIARWFTDLGEHLTDKICHVTSEERTKWNKATQTSVSRSLANGTKIGTITIDGTNYDLYCETNTDTNTDTKNTAGSTDTNSKLFLIGATSQAANPQTHSHDTAYVGTDGCLYSNNSKTVTAADITQSAAVTAAGQKVLDAREKNAAIEGTLANLIAQQNSNLIKHNFYTRTHVFSNTPTHKDDVYYTWAELGLNREDAVGCTIAWSDGNGNSWLFPAITKKGIYIRFMYDETWETTLIYKFDVMTL